VPADCIVIESSDFTVDENFYRRGDNRAVKKQAVTNENYRENPDPFLLSQTLVTNGSAKAVVVCVGANSRRGIQAEKLDTTSKTAL